MSSPRRTACVHPLTGPPAEALEAVERAAQRCDELAGLGLEVAFRRTPRGFRAELRTVGGELVRELAPSEALAFAAG